MTYFLLVQHCSESELAAISGNPAFAPALRNTAGALLQARLAHAAGDYFTAARAVARMRKVAT